MGSKKLQVWLPFLFALVLSVGMWLGYQLRENTTGAVGFLSNTKTSTLQEILNLIENKYVDKVAADSLEDEGINDMLGHLDPHSVYIPSKETESANEDLKGNFEGIGIEFQVYGDTVNVVSVVPNGPSNKAGLEIGDKIIKVNDTANVAGVHINGDGIKKLLRGVHGTPVKLTVLHNSQMKDITITRGTIPLPALDASYIIAPKTGYIRLNKFSETTYPEFMDALEKLQKQGMDKLILDLRENGGGLISQAVDLADEFLDDEKLVVYTQGLHSPRKDYTCQRPGLFEKGKLVVLIDETTASASEIVTGALQDWDRATIIGRRSFGKGLVQEPFMLSDGSQLRLTIARYYTPVGRNIQKPYDKGKDIYEEELYNRFHDGELVKADTAKQTGTAFKTPGGHTVYGGGGIMPDIFVAYDTSAQPHDQTQLYFKGTINNFVYNYYMQNKSTLQNFKSPEEFYKQFHPGENEWLQLSSFAKKDSINLDNIPARNKSDVLQRFQTLLTRQIWRTEGYYEVSNENDPMIKKALEELK